MIEKIRSSLLSNDKPQDKNVMWIDTSNPESFTLKLFRNGDWKPLHVVGTTRDMIERELTGYVTSHYHSYDKIINKPTTLTGYGITDCFNKTEIESLLNKKVTKVSGKSLSTNDFTNEDKSKLTNLKNYDDTQVRKLIAGKANLQHQHTVADITDFPELYYDATAFFTSKIYPSDKYKELLEAVKAKKTIYAIIDEEGYISYVFFTSSTNSDGLSSRVLLTTMFADGGYLYMNTFVLQQSGMTTLRENITGKANKATTLAGYGIMDAYTKKEVDTALKGKQDTISDIDAIRSNAQKGNDASNILTDIVDAGYVFAGVAIPTTNPGVPDAKVFYIANGKGTYTNFGGLNVTEDDVVVLYLDSSWHKVSTGIASQEKLSELSEKMPDDDSGDFSFVDKYGFIAAIINKYGVKAVNFIFPDGESVLDKIQALELPVEVENGNFVKIPIAGDDGAVYLCDKNANIAIKISADGKVSLCPSEETARYFLNNYGELLNTYGKDFDFDVPPYVFGIESGTRTGREYFTTIYPEAMVHNNIPVLIDGAKKAIMQLPKINYNFIPSNIKQTEMTFSIGGNGYRKKEFSTNYIRANRNIAKGKTIGMLALGDSITEENVYFPVSPAERYGRGSWQDWVLVLSIMDNKDVAEIPIVKAIGTKNYHPYSVEYNGETLPYEGHAEGVSGWATYGYLNYPCWARLDDAYEDVQGNRKNRLDGEAMYYAAGLATETPFDSSVVGHDFIAWQDGIYDSKIVHTPMGRFKPDCCEALWNALKNLFTDFYNANSGAYNGSESDAIIVSYLNDKMDNPTNPFFDKERARTYTDNHQWTYSNAFSIAKYLERYRNCDDEGNPLVGNAGETVIGGDGNTYTIGTNLKANSQVFMPTHAISGLGTNDGTLFFVECQMELLHTLVDAGISHVGYWLPRRCGVLNPQLWNEYGLQKKLTEFLYAKNNAIMDAIGELNINKSINYIPCYFSASPVSAGQLDALAYDFDYIDSKSVVCGTDSIHPSAFQMRSIAYQCLAWIYWTLQ